MYVTLSSPKTRSVFSCPERDPDPFLFSWKSRCIIGRHVLVSGPHNAASHLGTPIWAFGRGLNIFGIWLVAPPRNGRRLEEGGKKKDAVRKQEDAKARNLFCNSVRDRVLASGNRVACIRG